MRAMDGDWCAKPLASAALNSSLTGDSLATGDRGQRQGHAPTYSCISYHDSARATSHMPQVDVIYWILCGAVTTV